MDRFQCTWVAMIGEMYELIAEYLGNGFRQKPAGYIGNALVNQKLFYFFVLIIAISFNRPFRRSSTIRDIRLNRFSPKFNHQPKVVGVNLHIVTQVVIRYLFPKFILRNLKRKSQRLFSIRQIRFCKIFVDTLTTISNRIRKHKKESSEATAFRQSTLFRVFSLSYFLVIPSYYNCAIQGISLCCMSIFDSSRCKVYVFTNRTDCNILEVTEKQLMNFAAQYICLKDEI